MIFEHLIFCEWYNFERTFIILFFRFVLPMDHILVIEKLRILFSKDSEVIAIFIKTYVSQKSPQIFMVTILIRYITKTSRLINS